MRKYVKSVSITLLSYSISCEFCDDVIFVIRNLVCVHIVVGSWWKSSNCRWVLSAYLLNVRSTQSPQWWRRILAKIVYHFIALSQCINNVWLVVRYLLRKSPRDVRIIRLSHCVQHHVVGCIEYHNAAQWIS